jgi:hypothetical protein
MDQNMIKKLAVVSIGAIVGGITGYFTGGLLVYKLLENEITQTEEEMLEELAEKEEADGNQLSKLEKEEKKPVKKKLAKAKGNHKMTPINYAEYFKKESLETLAAPYQSSIDSTIEETHEAESPINPDIRISSQDEWVENHGYARDTITYYEEDDTLCDQNEGIISVPEDVIGPDALLNFGKDSQDPDIIYVRNTKTHTDYEVIRVHNSYQRLVLGVKDKPTKPRTGKKVKTKNDESQDN